MSEKTQKNAKKDTVKNVENKCDFLVKSHNFNCEILLFFSFFKTV